MPRALQDRLTICLPARALAHPHWCPIQHSQPCCSLPVAQATSPHHAGPTLLGVSEQTEASRGGNLPFSFPAMGLLS